MRDNNRKIGHTVVGEIDAATLRLLRSFVSDEIRHLQWRHSGLGMLQAYVLEGGQEEVRVHIWHPSLKLDGIDEAGMGHDHRFDMTSWVLAGQLTHSEIETSRDPKGRWKIYEVVNARKALRETGSRAGKLRLIEDAVELKRQATTISAGDTYFFPKRTFHETRPDSPIVITIALKTNQDESPARVLCGLTNHPLNAFGTSLTASQRQFVLARAEAVLREVIARHDFGLQEDPVLNHFVSESSSRQHLKDSLFELSRLQLAKLRPPPYRGDCPGEAHRD
jgi:hypothetical protein